MKPGNQILIVDEKEFYRIKKKAEMTDSEIEAMVEKIIGIRATMK